MQKIYCIGETVYDIIFKNEKPIAAKAGGSMLNSTVSMGKIKLPVHFISEYGQDDIGNTINSFLESSNVNTQNVYRHSQGKTSIAIAFLNEQNDARYTFYKENPGKRLDIQLPVLQENDIVLFGSYFSINRDVRKKLLTYLTVARKTGAIIIYDPNFRAAHFKELKDLMPFIIENMKLATLVRGSDEDFQMIFNADNPDSAFKFVSKYCPLLIYTMNSKGVILKTPDMDIFQEVPQLKPLSTIGAGDNFNSGLIFGLVQENVKEKNISKLNKDQWIKIITHGIQFASDVCMSYDNYISDEFASKYANMSRAKG